MPAPLQRVLFGPPARIDGQVLAPEMQALVRVASLARDESASAYGKLTPRQARARIRAGAAAAAERDRSLALVSDLSIPGPDGAIPARFYEPEGLGLEGRPLIVYFHGGGWIDRRPRHPRQRLPLPRRHVPAPRARRSTTGWRPSTASRPRSKTPSPPSAGPP